MTLGERLRVIRKRLGYTQREAASKAGIQPQHLSAIERGQISNPELDTLTRIATAYGMGVDDLVGRGAKYALEDLPEGLRALLTDPEWAAQVTPAWVETLMRIEHQGRRLRTKQEFLEAYLALRRIVG